MSTPDSSSEVVTPSVPETEPEVGLDAIHRGDCVELLQRLPDESVDLAFADPPFNIGFEYDEYHDDHDDEDYLGWCERWMGELYRVVKPTGAFWLAIGDEYAAELKVAAKELGFTPRNWIVWYYTFGQNCTRKFNRSHAHVFHFVKDEELHTFNAQDPAVRVPSARALVYGDRRANPTGRLPDDTWVLRPQDLRNDSEAFQPMDDTWYFSRVAGTFKERQGFHGCQMPEQLLARIVRISSDPGQLVLDPFSGSGTTLAVAKKLGRRWLGFELSKDYAKYGSERLECIHPGDELNGPADPVQSSPTTAAGRKLKGHPLVDQQKSFLEAEEPKPAASGPTSVKTLREMSQDALIEAFLAAHDGHSIDWLLCDPDLQRRFHDLCGEEGLMGGPGDWNHELLRLRKAGRMPKRDLKKVDVSADEIDCVAAAAEIAWRQSQQKHPGASLDELFSSPGMGFFFDRAAGKQLAETKAPASTLRWAALRNRKARKSLANEAKQFDYVLAKRDFGRCLPWSRFRPERFDGEPGLYLVRGVDKSPLYLGETHDLGRRLTSHLGSRAFSKLAAQVSLLPASELPSNEYRAPLWVDLVRRYEPRLNVPPADPST